MQFFIPPTITAAQEALLTMQQLREEALQNLADKTCAAFDLFWHNEHATVAEMAEALGTNAQAAFAQHAAAVTYLLTHAPELLPDPASYTPPQAISFAEDGSLILF